MAKTVIAGNAVVITSTMKLEELKMVQKYRPDALVIKGGEDNKEELFRVGAGSCGINTYGVSFEHETYGEEKLATISFELSYKGDDVKGYIADKFGAALKNLETIEKKLPKVIEEINKERAAIMDGITITE